MVVLEDGRLELVFALVPLPLLFVLLLELLFELGPLGLAPVSMAIMNDAASRLPVPSVMAMAPAFIVDTLMLLIAQLVVLSAPIALLDTAVLTIRLLVENRLFIAHPAPAGLSPMWTLATDGLIGALGLFMAIATAIAWPVGVILRLPASDTLSTLPVCMPMVPFYAPWLRLNRLFVVELERTLGQGCVRQVTMTPLVLLRVSETRLGLVRPCLHEVLLVLQALAQALPALNDGKLVAA